MLNFRFLVRQESPDQKEISNDLSTTQNLGGGGMMPLKLLSVPGSRVLVMFSGRLKCCLDMGMVSVGKNERCNSGAVLQLQQP